ncbi:kinesin-domain-containing protein [Flagelloscypha sp. PMI_526]|nr:kinesin-domain-containing protein [Flagelloscypha sp. PMI_526]
MTSTAKTTKIHTIARLRPFLPNELTKVASNTTSLIQADTAEQAIRVNNPHKEGEIWNYPFGSVYGSNNSTKEIYENDVKDKLARIYDGVTFTIFAYGVTGSGKTFTMQGDNSKGGDGGLVGLVIRELFTRTPAPLKVSIQYLEIYKDDIYDLLVPRAQASKLTIKGTSTNEVVIAGLKTEILGGVDDFNKIYSKATQQRSTGSTNLNHSSSRSHSILTLLVETDLGPSIGTAVGKVNLVDLAGSENNKLTGADKDRLSESAAINKSLTTLGMVVEALNKSGDVRIPYRDTKLTRVLQPALGGSSLAMLVLNLSPNPTTLSDAVNSLNFATRTKKVECKVVENVRPAPPPATKRASMAGNGVAPRASVAGPGHKRGPSSSIPRSRFSFAGVPGNLPPALGIGSQGINLGLMDSKELDERIAKMVEEEVGRRLAAAAEKQPETAPVPAPEPTLAEVMEVEDIEMEDGEGREEELDLDRELEDKATAADSSHDSGYATGSTSEPTPSAVVIPTLQITAPTAPNTSSSVAEPSQSPQTLTTPLSPPTLKKTAQAYCSLARTLTSSGDLHSALAMYRKAQLYVTQLDGSSKDRLEERILDMEYAIKNGVPFESSRHEKGERKRVRVYEHGASKKRRREDDEAEEEGGGGKRGRREKV